jgi:hypothetical protein
MKNKSGPQVERCMVNGCNKRVYDMDSTYCLQHKRAEVAKVFRDATGYEIDGFRECIVKCAEKNQWALVQHFSKIALEHDHVLQWWRTYVQGL